IPGGPGQLTGAAVEAEFGGTTDAQREQVLAGVATPEVYVDLCLDPSETIYLLGDSTPFYYRNPVLYHTTWDRSPLGEAVRAVPDDPAAWAQHLRGLGIRYIVVNMSELQRLIEVDHWYDPDGSVARVQRFGSACCEPVREWPRRGQVLVRLLDPGQARPAAGGGERSP